MRAIGPSQNRPLQTRTPPQRTCQFEQQRSQMNHDEGRKFKSQKQDDRQLKIKADISSDKNNELKTTADTESTTDTSFDTTDYYKDDISPIDNSPTDLSAAAALPSAPLFDYESSSLLELISIVYDSRIKSNITTQNQISTNSTAPFDSNDFSAEVISPTNPSVNAADSPTSTNNSTTPTLVIEISSDNTKELINNND